MAMGDVIARLAVSLNLETASFEKGSKRAQSEVGKLRGSVQKAAGAIGAAFAGMMSVEFVKQWADMSKQALDAVGSLGEVATQLGVTTDALQEYRYVASQTGIQQAEMDQALSQLTRRLGEAAQGAKAPTEALKALGISLKDVKGLSAGDVIPLIAAGMAQLEDDTQRAAVAVDLFGKSGQKLMPLLAEGKTGIEAMRKAARDLGIVLTEEMIANADATADALSAQEQLLKIQTDAALATPENARAVAEYTKTITQLRLELFKLLPQIQPAFDQLEKGSHRLGEIGRSNVIESFWDSLTPDPAVLQSIGSFALRAAEYMGKMASEIGHAISIRLGAIWDGALKKIEQVKSAFYNMYDAVIGHSYVPDMVDGIAAQMARLDDVMVKPVTAATTKAQLAFRDMASSVRDMMGNLFPEEQAQLDYGNQRKTIADALAAGVIDQATADKLSRGAANAEDERRAGNRPSIGWMNDVEPMGPGSDLDPERLLAAVPAADALGERLARLQLVFGQVGGKFGDMAASIVGLINTGINPAVDSTIEKFAQMQTAMQGVTSLLQSIFGKKAGGILGGILQIGTALAGAGGLKIPGFASGTSSAPRGLAMVGERGPELVNFRGGERVYNNRDSRGMMGGTVNNYFSGNLMTPEFWGRIQAGDVAAASAGAAGGAQRVAYAQSRRVG